MSTHGDRSTAPAHRSNRASMLFRVRFALSVVALPCRWARACCTLPKRQPPNARSGARNT
eukprot:3529187-Pyramimonas_sp.AAC.2